MANTAPRITISAVTGSEVDEKLNASVRKLQQLAKDNPTRGILVTRLGPGRFTVELSTEVPYGFTQEQEATQSVAAESRNGNVTSARVEIMQEPVLLAA